MNTLRKALPRTFIATAENCAQILSVTNEAFMADAFFKKPEYHLRFDTDTVLDMIKSPNSAFILATFDKPDITSPEVCGSIFFNWTSELQSNDDNSFNLKIVGHFSAVSVPEKFGKRGIGKTLVSAAEKKLKMEVTTQQVLAHTSQHTSDDGIAPRINTTVHMEMGVINLRKDLFPWYESQGYRIEGEIRPNDAEITRIILDDLDVCCVLMKKEIFRNGV